MACEKGCSSQPVAAPVGDALYLISDKGVASCLDAKRAKNAGRIVSGEFSASPVLCDGKIFLQNETGDGIVLEPGKEYRELAKNPIGEKTLASYAVGDGAFIRSEKHLARMQVK